MVDAISGRVDVQLGGVKPQMDDTDKLAVSLYGKNVAAGDVSIDTTPLGVLAVAVGHEFTGADNETNILIRNISNLDTFRIQTSTGFIFNGTGWDRVRNNTEVTLLASVGRTGSTASPDQTNFNNSKGAILIIDVSAITATPVLTPKLHLKDPISSNYIDIWTAAANLTAVGTVGYLFGLGGTGSAGDYAEGVNIILPRTYRFQMVHADTDLATYSVAIVLLA